MPPLNEGDILYMPTAPPGMSVTTASKTLQTMDAQLKQFPEVEHVFGKIGRSTSATDSAPLSMVETMISLKPKDQWRKGLSWDDLIAEMDQVLDYPGMPNIWWMPIQTRTEMLATGIRSNLGIKILGDDIQTLEKLGVEIETILQSDPRTEPYTRSAYAERLNGGYYLDFEINRDKIARYGLTIADVEETLSTAIGGHEITQIYEGRGRYAVNLRYARQFRDNLDAMSHVLLPTPNGAQIPISQVAKLTYNSGPPMLRNENMVPLTLAIIFFLLFLNHGSVIEAGIILCTIPFALTGAIWILYLLNFKLSIAVWVGLIALAGLVAEMGVLMMLYLNQYYQYCQKKQLEAPLYQVISRAAAQRIRPMLMTSLTLLLSFTPILYSDGTGADVMKRIAAPMVGGVLTTLVIILIVYPVIFSYWKDWEIKHNH